MKIEGARGHRKVVSVGGRMGSRGFLGAITKGRMGASCHEGRHMAAAANTVILQQMLMLQKPVPWGAQG